MPVAQDAPRFLAVTHQRHRDVRPDRGTDQYSARHQVPRHPHRQRAPSVKLRQYLRAIGGNGDSMLELRR